MATGQAIEPRPQDAHPGPLPPPAEFLGGFDGHAADMTVAAIDGASHFIVDDRPDVAVERTLAFFAGR